MRIASIPILLAAGVALAGVAGAQTPPAPAPSTSFPPGPVYDPEPNGHPILPERPCCEVARGNPMPVGVAALKDDRFELAQEMFGYYLQRKPNSADANFYMGVAKMNLGKWEEARKHLEIAIAKKPKHPDPKSRLGVTYAKLGDSAGANAQRAELIRMADACKGSCKLSPFILGGIEMIDEALAEAPPASEG